MDMSVIHHILVACLWRKKKRDGMDPIVVLNVVRFYRIRVLDGLYGFLDLVFKTLISVLCLA